MLRPAKSCLLEGRPERIRELAPEATGFALATRRHAGGAGRPGARAGDGPEGAGTPLARHTDGEPSEATTLGPLPTGRHGMTRAAVRHSQRERLLAGVVAAVAERGYPETRIGDVVARAEVSRRVFYEHFESVEECFLCAVEIVATHLGEIAAAAAEKADASPKAVTALRAVLDFLADEPDLARACMVESLAVGATGQRRYGEAVEAFAAALRTNLTEGGGGASSGSAEMAVGSVAMVISLRIAAGRVEDLPSLESELAELLLGPLSG